jgi:hypothetical protein
MKSKRGLSTIVTTLIIMLLIMVAVGIVWFVVNNLIQESTGQVSTKTKCIGVSVTPIKVVSYSGGVYQVTLSRNAADEEIGGVRLVFTSDEAEDNYIENVGGDIALLGKKIVNVSVEGLTPTKVEAFVYFANEGGEPQICTGGYGLEF